MNGVPEYFELKLKQTSKGVWYCDGFTTFHEAMLDAVALADDAMTAVERIVKKHNKEAEK